MCHQSPVYCPHVYNAAEVLTIQHQQKQCFMPITFYLYMLFSEKYVEVRLFYYFFSIFNLFGFIKIKAFQESMIA